MAKGQVKKDGKMKIVIIGGGIIGGAIAYYLAQAQAGDISLIEKEKVCGLGVTQYCSGGVRHQFTTAINVQFSLAAFKELRQFDIGYKKLGYLILDTESNCRDLTSLHAKLGVKSECLSPADIKRRFSYINIEGVRGGSFYAEDGIADPGRLLAIYEKGARQKGVKFFFETTAHKIVKEKEKIQGVETSQGFLPAEVVVLAGGLGSEALAKTIGLDLPFVKRRKYIGVIEGFDFDFPLVMETPLGWYIKKENNEALVGMSGEIEEKDFEKQQMNMEKTIEHSLFRFPLTEKSGLKRILSSLSDETPDKHAIIDNSIFGLIIAAGFSGHGFMHSPAAGQLIANIIKEENPIIENWRALNLKRSCIKEKIAI